jgi:predicted TIM-barrel fold metal-dependent hydrolase
VTALERARTIVDTWNAELRRELPEHARLFDAHTHLGSDIDGMVGDYDELAAVLDRYGFEHAFTFCLDEPDREPAFSRANERTLAHAARSEGRLIPFVRLDLTTTPLHEARRCLDLGARGIKLHPRAQAFALNDERLQPIFALAVERDVPILIHGGRGLPPIAEDLEALVRRNEGVQLIVAHAGIADMAELAGRLGGIPGVFFDTSVWSGLDLLDLYRQVSPEQVLYASDYPYGRQPNSLLVSVRTAKLAGFDDKQLRLMLGGSARRIADREPLEPLSRPKGPASLVQPLTFARIHQYISMAVPMLWLRQKDAIGAIGLAVNASRERANGQHEPAERIQELLMTAQELWRECAELEDAERVTTFRAAIQLVNLADMVSLTTRA